MNTLDVPTILAGGPSGPRTYAYSLPAPPDPFANVPGFNQGGSGCFPTGCDYPQPIQRTPIWNIPRNPSGGGQQGVCWWCNPSGGVSTQPQQPIFINKIPTPTPIPPPPIPIIPQPRQPILTGGGGTGGGGTGGGGTQPIFLPIPVSHPIITQQPIQTILPWAAKPPPVAVQPPIQRIPIVTGPPVTPVGGGGKQPINVIPTGGVDLPKNILLPGGIGPTVGPFPAWSYNPQTNTLTMPKLRLGPTSYGPAGVPSFGSVPSPGLPGGGPTGGIGAVG